MPDTQTVAITTYFLPDESSAVHAAIIALIDNAQHTLRLCMYGFDDPDYVDALCRAHTRGVDVLCIFDHSQASGPHEVAMLHRLMLTLPPANIRIGTSPAHGQIIHIKALVADALQVCEGSFNWSPSAREQVNDLNITVSADRAAAYNALFDRLWAWLTAHEPAYQPTA